MRKWKPEAYMESMMEQIPFICRDIVKLPIPIDLYSAYGEYRYEDKKQFPEILNIK